MIEAIACSLAAAVIAFAISVATIPAIRRIAMAMRVVDYPGWRKHQAFAVPRMGGVVQRIAGNVCRTQMPVKSTDYADLTD
jgi:UDP-N-acetylmuramyl pentapeptide phosphotransferase/UDP-N-acetylglucosamine-1-phosphate transferase